MRGKFNQKLIIYRLKLKSDCSIFLSYYPIFNNFVPELTHVLYYDKQ